MSRKPQLDLLGLSDPIISSDLSALSPTRTPRSPETHFTFTFPGSPTSQRFESSGNVESGEHIIDESAPLLGGSNSARPPKKPFYRPRPLWLVPFAIIASLARGMTLAPRVEVFTQLACGTLHHSHIHYNHTSSTSNQTVGAHAAYLHNPYPSTYSSQDSEGSRNTISIRIFENGSSDGGEDDPRNLPSEQCMSDSGVQAKAARLQTIMTTIMGTLSALTTGWWGHFGERHGRTRVLAITTFGLFLTDLMFILVSTPHTPFAAHGHKLLIVAPFIEGILGGWSTLQSATTSYISDCTSDGSRAQIFSRFTGVFYLGLSAGPAIGAFLIKHPFMPFSGTIHAHPIQSVTSVFWVSILLSFINVLLMTFVFPESLTKDKRAVKDVPAVNAEAVDASQSDGKTANSWAGARIVKAFLAPLAIFLPKVIVSPGGTSRKDWNLTFLALAMFGSMLSTGVISLKYLFAQHTYKWGAEQLSYYISWLGGLRAVHLLFILPFIIATFKPKSNIKATPDSAAESAPKPKATRARLALEMHFDIFLTRLSFIIDIIANIFIVLCPSPERTTSALSMPFSSQTMFIAASSLTSFGAGVMPALQSLALCILQSHSLANASAGGSSDQDVGVGQLFGALAVLQAVGQMILGPMLFGVIYSTTVATYPKAIFATTAGICFGSLALVFMIRPDAGGKGKRRRTRADAEEARGRSRVSKDLRVWVPEGLASGSGSV